MQVGHHYQINRNKKDFETVLWTMYKLDNLDEMDKFLETY